MSELCCDSCQGCQVTCNTTQNLCVTNSNVAIGGFFFDHCYKKNEIIGPEFFSRDTWNKAVDFINNIASKGEMQSNPPLVKKPTVTYMKADDFNALANKISAKTVSSGDIIYGTYFENLEKAINNFHYIESQCDQCVVECDKGCDKCENCANTCCGCDSDCEACEVNGDND